MYAEAQDPISAPRGSAPPLNGIRIESTHHDSSSCGRYDVQSRGADMPLPVDSAGASTARGVGADLSDLTIASMKLLATLQTPAVVALLLSLACHTAGAFGGLNLIDRSSDLVPVSVPTSRLPVGLGERMALSLTSVSHEARGGIQPSTQNHMR